MLYRANTLMDVEDAARKFLKNIYKKDISNEAEFQFELASFIKDNIPGSIIYFERSYRSFGIEDSNFVKKEIDLVIQKDDGTLSAIELKYPKNGRVPETMYDFIKDIKFLEQLAESKKFKRNLFLVITSDKKFWSGKSKTIYAYFRGNEAHIPKTSINKPTGQKRDASIKLDNKYRAEWESISDSSDNKQEMKFLLIEVN